MPVLTYLADTNTVSDFFRPGNPVKEWFGNHLGTTVHSSSNLK